MTQFVTYFTTLSITFSKTFLHIFIAFCNLVTKKRSNLVHLRQSLLLVTNYSLISQEALFLTYLFFDERYF